MVLLVKLPRNANYSAADLKKWAELFKDIDKKTVMFYPEGVEITQLDIKPNEEVVITCQFCGYKVVPKGEVKACPHCGGKV